MKGHESTGATSSSTRSCRRRSARASSSCWTILLAIAGQALAGHAAAAGQPRLAMSVSQTMPTAVTFTFSAADGWPQGPCGVELSFGDGTTAEVELDLAGGRSVSVEHRYKTSMAAAVSVTAKPIRRFLRSVWECTPYTPVTRWVVVDREGLERSGALTGGDFDIVVLARSSKRRDRDDPFMLDMDGAVRLRDPASPVCLNTTLLRGVGDKRFMTEEIAQDARVQADALLALGSLYEQLGISAVGAALDVALQPFKQRLGGRLYPCSGQLFTGDLIALPRFAVDMVDATAVVYAASGRSIKDFPVATTAAFSELSKAASKLAQEEAQRRSDAAALVDSYEKAATDGVTDRIGTLIIAPELALRFLSSKPFPYCTLPSEGAAYAAVAGHRSRGAELLPPGLLPRFQKSLGERLPEALGMPARDSGRKTFDLVVDDLNDGFVMITADRGGSLKCPIFVGPVDQVVRLKRAMERDGIPAEYGQQTDAATARTRWALQLGLRSWEQLELLYATGASLAETREMGSFGVDSKATYDAAATEMLAAGYTEKAGPYILLRYLADRRDGSARGVDAVAQRRYREEQESAAAERRRATERAERDRLVREFPFEAVLSCGYRVATHANIILCFAGTQDGLSTRLELLNGTEYGLYGATELRTLGQETPGVGLVIPLRSRFALKAQNAGTASMVLTVKIRDARTGQELFIKSADNFQTIRYAR